MADAGEAGRPDVEIRRSARRRRTVSAYREGDRFVVLVPARMSARDAEEYARELVGRLEARERRSSPTDDDLAERARALRLRWLPQAPEPSTVRWVTNQNRRWGSCTPADRSIRLSHRLRGMPEHVVDYVLLHELAHLLVADHGPDFQSLLAPYPRLLEARAFLAGVDFASNGGPASDGTHAGPDTAAATPGGSSSNPTHGPVTLF